MRQGHEGNVLKKSCDRRSALLALRVRVNTSTSYFTSTSLQLRVNSMVFTAVCNVSLVTSVGSKVIDSFLL